jgi:hypothetical protein
MSPFYFKIKRDSFLKNQYLPCLSFERDRERLPLEKLLSLLPILAIGTTSAFNCYTKYIHKKTERGESYDNVNTHATNGIP